MPHEHILLTPKHYTCTELNTISFNTKER